VWSVTELGETVAEDQIPTLRAEYTASRRKKGPKKKGAKSNLDNEIDQADAEAEADWKDALLDTILSISPHAFERLAQRLLREAESLAQWLPEGLAMAALMVAASTRSHC
jgi:restriction system protein